MPSCAAAFLVIVFAASSIFYALVIRSGSLEAGEVIDGLPLTWTPWLHM
jgi:hypothetical protein